MRPLAALVLVAAGLSIVGPGRAVVEDVEGLVPRPGCTRVERAVTDDDSVAAVRRWRCEGDAVCARVQQKCARGLPWETALFHDAPCS